jgi:hypothetical protein
MKIAHVLSGCFEHGHRFAGGEKESPDWTESRIYWKMRILTRKKALQVTP